MNIRIGQGYDVHRFAENRKLIVGGVEIPYDRGLLGHSDADVLFHAVADALLGSLALGDIGQHFPDTDPALAGADSGRLLTETAARVSQNGYIIGNVDCTLIAQAPKLAPFLDTMRTRLADCLKCGTGQISIKATTTERLGFTGRKEGIAAQAIVLVRKSGKD